MIARLWHRNGWQWLLTLAMMLGGLPCMAAVPMQAAWRALHEADTAQTAMDAYRQGQFQRFDPAYLQHLPRTGSWVVLTFPAGHGERQLSIYPPPLGMVTLYDASGQGSDNALDDFAGTFHGHGRISFRLGPETSSGGTILLKFAPTATLSTPISFALQSRDAYERTDANWLAMASACFAVMLVMSFMAVCFAAMLRDATFAWYAGYVLCYALIQAVQTGYIFHPLDWSWFVGSARTIGMIAVVLSVAFAALFMARFCELHRYAPWLQAPVGALVIGMPLLLLLRCSQIALLEETAQALLNPTLVLGALLLLIAAIMAAARGSRQAWFFLLGWTPLLVLTALCSSQVNGALPRVLWLNDASLAAGAFEAIVLSLGLGDRALNARRDRDLVRVLADNDALTNVLNRRAWTESARDMLAHSSGESLSLLFMDLDNFKALNDRQGHAAGDRALVAVANALRHELRPGDLLGRYGGEEFVVALRGLDQDQAMEVATRLCRRIYRLEIAIDDQHLLLSASIGTAMRIPGDTIESLLERADQAMYTAKVNGRNRVQLELRLSKT
ncbi:diguanylate cyclase [Dyella sp.]|uniref:GGDEF domain-containing protein n=1 Tax=Dyella sp. TaxID=1869338 RepID=UPI002ED3D684